VDGSPDCSQSLTLDPAGDPLPLPQWHHPFVGDERTLADLVFVAADHALRCHTLEQQREGRPCFLRHPQRLIDLSGAETVTGLVRIHGEGAEHCPLIGGTEGLAVGERGEHVVWCG